MVLEDVRVFVKVDRLKGELSQTFASIGIGRRIGSDTTTSEL